MEPDSFALWYATRGVNYIDFAMTTWVAYEYVITFDREISLIWLRKMTITSLLWVSTRWVMVLTVVVNCMPDPDDERGYAIEMLYAALSILELALLALFSGLRVYAFCQHWKLGTPLAVLTFALACMPVATNIVQLAGTLYADPAKAQLATICTCQYVTLGGYTPIILFTTTVLAVHTVIYVTRGSSLAADVLLLGVTWIETFTLWRASRRLRLPCSISTLLLRDGTAYFLALLALTVMKMAVAADVDATDMLTIILTTTSPLLINRFMLNLRQHSDSRGPIETGDEERSSHINTPNFHMPVSTLGNIGEPLDYGWPLRSADDREDCPMEGATTSAEHSEGEPGLTAGMGSGYMLSEIAETGFSVQNP